jgi:hypothetical protein
MKFLRIATNSLISGFFFCLLLALLVADLNINLVLKPFILVKLAAFLMLSYGLFISLLCAFIYTIYRFISGKKNKIGFVSPSFLVMSFSLLTLLFLLIFRENFVYFYAFFVPGLQSLLKIQMMALFVLAVAGLFLYYKRRQGPKPLYFRLYFALLVFILSLTLIQRLNYPPPQKSYRLAGLETKKIEKKVTILGLDGLSLDLILPLANERKIPNFSWLMEGGSWGHLESLTPNDPFILHHSFNTGKFPGKHHRISDVRYGIPGLDSVVEVVPRFILFRQLKRVGLLKIFPNEALHPAKDIWKIFENDQASFLKKDIPLLENAAVKPDPKTEKAFNIFYKDLQSETSKIFGLVKQAFVRDSESEEKASQQKTEVQPQLFSLFLNGLNTTETYFYKYNFPEAFGEIKQDEIQKFGPVIEKYYQFYDQIIGKYLAALKENELLVVYSPHGIEPLPFWKRLVEWILGNSEVSAYHEQAPDGAFFFYGNGIAKGKNVDSLRLVDVMPALLYYLGLPVGKDMDGIVRSALFTKEFTEENPLFYISSYEDVNFRRLK